MNPQTRRNFFLISAAALLLMIPCGCMTAPVGADRVSTRTAYKQVEANVLSTGEPSGDTVSVLHRFNLTELARKHPDQAVILLHEKAVAQQDRNILFALAELS